MAKKIYDIKPPRTAAKRSPRRTKKEPKETEKPRIIRNTVETTAPQIQNPGKKKSVFWPVFIPGALVVFAVLVYLFFALPKATVEINPVVNNLSFQQAVKADKLATSLDIAKAVLPAEYVEVSKTGSEDFAATGNASNEGRASGTITVFNKADPAQSFTFKEGTRFLSDSGKLFLAPNKIVIPAAKKSGNKITPGSVTVKVEAAEGGDSYNIAPSNFSVPGLKGTALYYSINATSASAMAGGFSSATKKVTGDDIQMAKDQLTEKTISEAKEELKEKVSADYIILDEAVEADVLSASTQAKSGTVAENFNYQVTVKARALVFKKSDLDQFARNYILAQVPEGKTLLENALQVNYSLSTTDVDEGTATINLDFSSGVYENIDTASLELLLMGKNKEQINQIISSKFGEKISGHEIKFWPFWVSSAPNSQKKVDVDLMFE